MARALVLGVIGAAALFGAPVAMADGAPAAFYPSLGYGQIPDYGPPQYGPSDYGRLGDGPPAYAPPRRYEPRGYDRDDRAGPPVVYERRDDEAGYGADRRQVYESRSEYEGGYDSGWRPVGPDRDDRHVHGGYASGGYGYASGGYGYADRGYGDHAYGGYAYGRHDRDDREHVYASTSRQEYDYDSGWRITAHELPPLREAAPLCPYAREEAPPPPPHQMCPSAERYDHGYAYEEEHVPDVFFADAGGVGPDEFEGGGGGGGYVVGGAASGAFAEASASAYASAHVGIGVHIGRHGGHHGGHHMPHGCGCRR